MTEIKCYCGHTITCDCGPLPKQTAVQELWDYIEANYHEENFDLNSAKKLSIENEKAQIEASYADGYSEGYKRALELVSDMFNEHYNETYKQD